MAKIHPILPKIPVFIVPRPYLYGQGITVSVKRTTFRVKSVKNRYFNISVKTVAVGCVKTTIFVKRVIKFIKKW